MTTPSISLLHRLLSKSIHAFNHFILWFSSRFHRVERRKLCSDLFNALVDSRQDIFVPRDHLYYDLRSMFYTTEKLFEVRVFNTNSSCVSALE